MKIIMTGGTGFIGKKLALLLAKIGNEVTIITSKNEVTDETNIRYVSSEYDLESINKKIKNEKYDLFYHLGWNGVKSREKNNIDLQISNVKTAIDMLKLSKQLECECFIAAGTVAEYAYSADKIRDVDKQTPNDVYGATKVAVHYLLESVAKELKQNMIWTVIPSTFGEGRTNDNILTYTIITLLKNGYPIYGELQQMWDFMYVEEVAKALWRIGQYGKRNTTYGIGSGECRKLSEYITEVRDMIDIKKPLGIGEIKGKLEPMSACVNIEKLVKDTNFKIDISFEEGMRRTIEYYRNNIENF